jgi:Mrp family chromosome partitioning ATPase
MNRMKQLVEHLKKDFDTIILDAPPYCPIADARIVTGLSDALIMVLRRGKTTFGTTDVALKSVDRNKLLGIVFNDVQPMLFHTYHNFSYGYGSKQYIYSNGDKSRKSSKFLKS